MQDQLTKENLSPLTKSKTLSCWLGISPHPNLAGTASPHCTKITELSQAKSWYDASFSTQLTLEGEDTACITIFVFPMLLFLGKKSFSRVPEDATEAVMVHFSYFPTKPLHSRINKVLTQKLHALCFAQVTCNYIHCGCICLGPSLVKDLAKSDLGSAVLLSRYLELS